MHNGSWVSFCVGHCLWPTVYSVVMSSPCLSVCTCTLYACLCVVCPRAYRRNYTPIFTSCSCMLSMAVARSCCGGVAICCVFPVLWVILCLHRTATKAYTVTKGENSKWLNRGQHGCDTAANTQTDPPKGSTGPGAESDMYACLVVVVLQTVRKLCEPTSDWAQYARQLADDELVTVKFTASDDNQPNDENRQTANTLMTTKCWKCRSTGP